MERLACSGLGYDFTRGSPADRKERSLLLHRPPAAVDQWRDFRVHHFHGPSPYPLLEVRSKGIDRPQGAVVAFS